MASVPDSIAELLSTEQFSPTDPPVLDHSLTQRVKDNPSSSLDGDQRQEKEPKGR